MFLIGSAGFTAASVLCGLAATPEMLIATRVLQGAFGALLIPQGFGIIKQAFPPSELGKAFGLFGPVLGMAALAAPILGGSLVDGDILGTGWRMIFLSTCRSAGSRCLEPSASCPSPARRPGCGWTSLAWRSPPPPSGCSCTR